MSTDNGDKDPQKTSETAALITGEALSQAVTAASDGIALIGPDGNLVFMNPALGRMFHLEKPLESYLNHPWQALYGQEGVDEIEQKILPYLAKQKVWRGESAVLRWDGSVFYAELTMDLLPDGSIVATARDATQRVQAQNQREALQQKLYQTQKMEALGRLAGGIAHEFNNILASIVGYADFLMQDLDKDSEQHRFASRISKAGKRGKELVNLVMSFSHPHRVSPQTTKLVDFITSTAPILQTALGGSARVSFETPDDDMSVRLDAGRMSEALLHICNNAADALGEEGGKVVVSVTMADLSRPELSDLLHAHETPETRVLYSVPFFAEGGAGQLHVGHLSPDKAYAVIRIQDDGPGIPPEVLQHVCEPFYTTRPPGFGSGLGLPAVVGVVGMHEGAMQISSEPGAGVCVEIFLPLVEGEEEAAAPGSKGASVLLVEKDDAISGRFARALEKRGYEVVCCQNADEAEEVLRDIREGWAAVATGPSVAQKIRSQIENLTAKTPMLDFDADEDARDFAGRVEKADA